MQLARLQEQRQLAIRQQVRAMVNQYEVHAMGPDGAEGDLLAFTQQKPWRSRSR